MVDRFKRWVDQQNSGPVAYLAVCVLAFGLFIPVLGFFWDDWPTIFYTFNDRTAQLINHFSYDRPFSVWAYWLVGRLGTAPVTWHLAALLLRWACAVALAWALRPLWPRAGRLVLFAGLIFAIYPGYYVQPSAVIFLPHLASLSLFLFSLGAMGHAAREPGHFWRYTALALLAAVVQIFTVEYYAGLELVRPLYLWFLFANLESSRRPSLAKVVRYYAPYAVVFAVWVAWRLFFLELPSEPYPIVLAAALRANPVGAVIELATTATRDLVYTFAVTWAELVPPILRFNSLFDAFIWIMMLASGVALYMWLVRQPSVGAESRAARQGLLVGFAAFVLGMFPIWAIGETIAQGDYNLRYILVGLTGAAIFVLSALTLLVRKAHLLALVVSILVALAIGAHLRAGENYRVAWEEQRSFFWQLAWRAPGFEQNTALVSFTPVSTQLRDPMTGNALNVLYPTAGAPSSVGLWNFELGRSAVVRAIESGGDLTNDYRGLTFSTGSADDLVFYYLPPQGCLWVLTPEDVANKHLPAEERELVAHANLDNILTTSGDPTYPPQHIFGAEPPRSWCYYYEKADLARQQGDWLAVFELMDEAEQRGFGPENGIEWLPLLNAHLATGELDAALALSDKIRAVDPLAEGMVCGQWQAAAVPYAPCDSQ